MRALGASVMVCMLVAQPCFGQDKATIEKLNASFVAAFQKGDMEAIGRMYAEDAYLLPSGAEMVKGRSAIQAYWTKAANTIGDIKLARSARSHCRPSLSRRSRSRENTSCFGRRSGAIGSSRPISGTWTNSS
jgi:hypothetical protein